MSFPTLGQTAFLATTVTGAIGITSTIVASKQETTSGTVFFGALGLIVSAASLASTLTYLQSEKDTTPKKYLENVANNTGHVVAGTVSIVGQTFTEAIIQGAAKAIRDNIYDYMRPAPKDDKKKKP